MTPIQTLEIRAGEIRKRLSDIGSMAELDDEVRSELDKLKVEYSDNDSKRAAITIAGDAPAKPVETASSEGRELIELRSRVDFGKYVAAAMSGNGVSRRP